MINTTDETKNQTETEDNSKKPDDYSSMYLRNFLKITDPESGQTILETAN
jgi:hypothetical protein